MKRFALIVAAILTVSAGVRAESKKPWLTIRWLPLTLPLQLAMHELSHAAVVPMVGGKVQGFDIMTGGHFAETRYTGVSGGFSLFAVSVAPRLLDIAEMIIFSKLHDSETDEDWRSFYNAMRVSAWIDFEYNTAKTLGAHNRPQPLYYGGEVPKGPSGNDGWDTADGLGLNDTSARAANATLAIGLGWVGFSWIF
jgi:hypothetical protein